ncbi:MAG: sigma-54-dependent Fis family transcriptional regulator [Bacteroidaceae bacterium]|nr:sigma-54-dependent Fis family transcriptional regulator [Bacteroidaceae bacterium]
MANSILIVEDDLTFATMLKTWLGRKGFLVYTASGVSAACKELEDNDIDLILSDLRLPDGDGTALLDWKREKNKELPVIIMTSYADIQSAVNAMKNGACDYVSKPVRPDELLKKIEEAIKSFSASVQPVKKAANSVVVENEYMEGKSELARQMYNYVSLVAPTPMAVLINGASGTGKEYVAKRIHMQSKRSDKPFVAIDCGSIPKELAASEFFGHVKGSFTGAINDKVGAFVEANGGTLFLDEVGNLGYDVQVQLLRALQERRIRPVGATTEIEVDVRIVCATNENLLDAIARGSFREDLYHRINEFTLRMPSLQERIDDIMLFANFFLDRANRELGRELIGFDAEATMLLQGYSWPGNLRQLKNVVNRATLLAQGNFITVADLDLPAMVGENANVQPLYDKDDEKKRIIDALKHTGNNKSKAAALLGIDRKTLYNKLKLYGVE